MAYLRVRFEQHRGLRMVVEDTEGWTRDSVNGTQLQMLKRCDVPGLLPIEAEEIDGTVAFKYDLTGCRMLGEALRASRWTMADAMGAICRVAEVLEDCRLYLLDANRVMLADEYIYVGGSDWQDLRFTYLPLSALPRPVAGATLEQLIVRWLTKVEALDGQAMQELLRVVTAPDFAPHALRGFVRRYLAGSPPARAALSADRIAPPLSAMRIDQPVIASATPRPVPNGRRSEPLPAPKELSADASKARVSGWRLLQPPTGDPHTMSELLGDGPPKWDDDRGGSSERQQRAREPNAASVGTGMEDSEKPPMDPHRRRTIAGISAAAIVAIAWKYAYMPNPGSASLMMCSGLTILAIACVIWFWNARSGSVAGRSSGSRASGCSRPSDPIRDAFYEEERRFGVEEELPEADHYEDDDPPYDSAAGLRFPIRLAEDRTDAERAGFRRPEPPAETTWLSPQRDDRTELLEQVSLAPTEPSCYLIWETRGKDSRVPLDGDSLVIGRSAEAAMHVDETNGVSRAHAELVRVAAQWRVKDLGSRNGSRINGKSLTPYELYPLASGDSLTLAGSEYRFVQEG